MSIQLNNLHFRPWIRWPIAIVLYYKYLRPVFARFLFLPTEIEMFDVLEFITFVVIPGLRGMFSDFLSIIPSLFMYIKILLGWLLLLLFKPRVCLMLVERLVATLQSALTDIRRDLEETQEVSGIVTAMMFAGLEPTPAPNATAVPGAQVPGPAPAPRNLLDNMIN